MNSRARKLMLRVGIFAMSGQLPLSAVGQGRPCIQDCCHVALCMGLLVTAEIAGRLNECWRSVTDPIAYRLGYGRTPLQEAVNRNNAARVMMLLDQGDDIDARSDNYKRETALHLAVKNRNLNMVKLLVENGADELVGDSDRKTPYRVALELREYRIAAYFKNCDAFIKKGHFEAVGRGDNGEIIPNYAALRVVRGDVRRVQEMIAYDVCPIDWQQLITLAERRNDYNKEAVVACLKSGRSVQAIKAYHLLLARSKKLCDMKFKFVDVRD